MGITDVFANTADFSRLTEKNDLKIDKIIHQAKFRITEKGSLTSAATTVTIIKKTTVVKKIVRSLPEGEVIVLPQDSYYKDNSHLPMEERQKINFDHPKSVEFNL